MSNRFLSLSLPLLLATTALVAPLALPAWAKVGVTSTTSGGPIGQPPQQPQRVLQVGVDVFADEHITTGPNDQAHLLFLDGSALTIGPNSDLVLDKFVYDPATETGSLALSASKGIFRLVGGKITKNDAATVRVGSATIGIRGGIVIIDAHDPQSVDSYFMFGDKLTVSTPLGSESALRPGSAIGLKRGQPPSSAHLVGPDALTGLLAQLEGRLGVGGARVSTVTNGAINSGVSNFSKTNNSDDTKNKDNTNNNNQVNSITVVTDNTLTPPTGTVADGRLVRNQPYTSFNPTNLAAPRDPANNALITTADVSGGNLTIGALNGASVTLPFQPGIVNVTSANSSSTYGPLSGTGYVAPDSSFYIYALSEVNNGFNSLTLVGGTPTAAANFPTTGFGQHTMLSLGGSAPFLPENVSNPAITNAYYSPLYSVYSPNITSANAALSAQRAVWFQGTLGFSGSGANQSSFFSLAVGGYFTDPNKNNSVYAAGSFQAYLRANGSNASEGFHGAVSTLDTVHGTTIYGLTGQNMAFGPDAVTGETNPVRTPQGALDQPLGNPTGTGYYFVSAAVGGTTQSTTPNTRNGGTFNGYAAALTDTRGPGNTISTGVLANEDPTKLTITTSPSTNRVVAVFDLHDAQNGSGGTTLRFGSTSGTYGQSSAYVDDKTFAAVQSPITPSSYSDGSSTNAIVSNVAMVSGGAVNNPLFAAAGVTPCTCAYLSWGYWAADLTYTSGARAGQQDRVPIGTWVAGTLPGTNEIPTGNISATYTGHMMGNVSNAGSSYVAVGDYTQQWNFASRSGTATINNFDGASFNGVALGTTPTNPRDFFGTGAGSQSRSISINGSFFKGGGDPVAAVGGNFRIGGTNYLATGSFAASK